MCICNIVTASYKLIRHQHLSFIASGTDTVKVAYINSVFHVSTFGITFSEGVRYYLLFTTLYNQW